MDRMGNTLDRTLFLAHLLRVAGYKVRLAHATLTPEQAKAALDRIDAAAAAALKAQKKPTDTQIEADAKKAAAARNKVQDFDAWKAEFDGETGRSGESGLELESLWRRAASERSRDAGEIRRTPRTGCCSEVSRSSCARSSRKAMPIPSP